MLREALAIGRFVLSHPVGRRRPLRCVFDTLRWQIGASTTPRVVPFVAGARLWARRGETGVTGNIYVGLHEFTDMTFVVHFLRPGDLFGDIGANAGSYTVLAAAVAGARVVAVEPVPEAAERLRANLELNGVADRVAVHGVAITDAPGKVRFTADADTVNRIAAEDEGGRRLVEVAATTLDALFADEPPLLLKSTSRGTRPACSKAAAASSPPVGCWHWWSKWPTVPVLPHGSSRTTATSRWVTTPSLALSTRPSAARPAAT